MNDYQLYLENETATLTFGRQLAQATFAEDHPPSDTGPGHPSVGGVIYLQGDLGAGKTTLTRGLMRGYGYEGAVKSPTYTLVEPYEFASCNIYHFDLYRLADAEELAYLGTEDYFESTNLCLVEWAERGEKLLPAADLLIELSGEGAGRRLSCQSLSAKGALIIKRL